jgi:hypothetical protein
MGQPAARAAAARHGAGLGERLPVRAMRTRVPAVRIRAGHASAAEASRSAGAPQAGCRHPRPAGTGGEPVRVPRVRCAAPSAMPQPGVPPAFRADTPRTHRRLVTGDAACFPGFRTRTRQLRRHAGCPPAGRRSGDGPVTWPPQRDEPRGSPGNRQVDPGVHLANPATVNGPEGRGPPSAVQVSRTWLPRRRPPRLQLGPGRQQSPGARHHARRGP